MCRVLCMCDWVDRQINQTRQLGVSLYKTGYTVGF